MMLTIVWQYDTFEALCPKERFYKMLYLLLNLIGLIFVIWSFLLVKNNQDNQGKEALGLIRKKKPIDISAIIIISVAAFYGISGDNPIGGIVNIMTVVALFFSMYNSKKREELELSSF